VALDHLGCVAMRAGIVLGAVALAVYWRRSPRVRLPRPVAAPALLYVGLLIGLAALPLRQSHSARPDVILVVIDTLRADYVDAERTPHIDALGEDGYRFSRAYSSAPWTLPSVGSLLTGRSPRDHGAGVNPETELGDGRRPLREDVETLAERFASHGYQTMGVITNPWLGRGSGIERGFEHFENLLMEDILIPGTFELTSTARFASARTQTDRALWVLRLRDPERPIFLMLHYMDMHQPRHPPKSLCDDERRAHPGTEPEVVYGADARLVDDEFGRLVAALKQRGRYAPSIIAVVSDHGEGLEQRGLREGHGKTLYPELVRVPLLIKPAAASTPQRCDGLVSLVDLGSTLLRLAGFDENLGVGVPRVARGGACANGADAVFQAITSISPSRDALVSGDRAVVWRHPDGWRAYDIERDPDYQHPTTIAAVPRLEEHVRLERELARRKTPTKSRELDPELVETLHALGYVP